MKIHASLADRVAGLEALFTSSGNASGTTEEKRTEEIEIHPELKKKIQEEIEICLNLYHLTMERPEMPVKKNQPKRNFGKRMSKEWN